MVGFIALALLLLVAALGATFIHCVVRGLEALSEASAIRAAIQSQDPDDSD